MDLRNVLVLKIYHLLLDYIFEQIQDKFYLNLNTLVIYL